jgi:hypothetical protein
VPSSTSTSRRWRSFFGETELRHQAYEASAAKHDWSDWYAAHIVAGEGGTTSDGPARDATLHVEASGEHAQK